MSLVGKTFLEHGSSRPSGRQERNPFTSPLFPPHPFFFFFLSTRLYLHQTSVLPLSSVYVVFWALLSLFCERILIRYHAGFELTVHPVSLEDLEPLMLLPLLPEWLGLSSMTPGKPFLSLPFCCLQNGATLLFKNIWFKNWCNWSAVKFHGVWNWNLDLQNPHKSHVSLPSQHSKSRDRRCLGWALDSSEVETSDVL